MPESYALIQLCRHGDIVSLLPIAKHLRDEGHEVTIVTASEFSPILGAVSYVGVIRHDTHHRDIVGATHAAKKAGIINIIKCQGGGQQDADVENFQCAQWARAGFLKNFHDFPLVFDNRDKAQEARALSDYIHADEKRPLILTNFKSVSSPYYQVTAQRKWAKETFGKDYFVLDISDICFRNVAHILGFIERAEVLITVDTLTLHLAYATGTPTIALSRFMDRNNKPTTYYNSEPRSHWVYHCSYADSIHAGARLEMERIIREKDYKPGRLCRDMKSVFIDSSTPDSFSGNSSIVFDKVRIDESKLAVARWKYNPAIIRINGNLLMAYRCQNDRGAVSHIAMTWIDGDFHPVGKSMPLHLKRSAEDPRLFTWGDRLFVGTCDGAGKQFASEITTNGHVLRDEMLPCKNRTEKNYLPFEHDGRLYCVYRFPHGAHQHEVWELDENFGIKANLCGTRKPLKWKWGEIRGSTPPVRVGDEYFTFFHSSFRDRSVFQDLVYVVGWLSFQAKPPFAITYMSPCPILWPELSSYGRGPTKALVTFPCGAVYDDGKWIVSAGANDAYCDLFCIEHDELLKDAESVEVEPALIERLAVAVA